ncbi:hypothetical protein Vretifemale_19300 [Volvox reticuliferus]|uniref:NYN domain-containing protein n=1 Tax=Volvox reticuliferus TaxID=1737510 RepID=A0A8J4D4I2_9CHLO|nr:hypothetical protein Vretifemale_19300 [Volvox reticuliferus]
MHVAAVAVRRDAADVRLVNDAMEFAAAAATTLTHELEPAVLCVSQDTDFAQPLRYLSERGVRTVSVSPHNSRRRTHAAMEPGTYFRRLPLPSACWAALKWESVATPVTDTEASWLREVIGSKPAGSGFKTGDGAVFDVPEKAVAAPTLAVAAVGSEQRSAETVTEAVTVTVTAAAAGAAAAERKEEVASAAMTTRASLSSSSSSPAALAALAEEVVVEAGGIGSAAAPAAMTAVPIAETEMDFNVTSGDETKTVVRDYSYSNERVGCGGSSDGGAAAAAVTDVAAAIHPGLVAYTLVGAPCPGEPTRLWLNPRYYT